jgi:signal transduction histidine kinase
MPDIQKIHWSWLRDRLFPRGTNLIAWTAYFIVIAMLIDYALRPPQVTPLRYISTLVTLALLLVINIIWEDLCALFNNRITGEWVLLWISTVLTFYAIIIGEHYNSIYILFIIAARANAVVQPIPALGFSALLIGIYLYFIYTIQTDHSNFPQFAVSVLIGFIFTITLSQVLRLLLKQSEQMRLLVDQIQQANTELLAARQKEKELAIAEERVRMARDLHDGLGHHLTALSIQLQAAEKLVRLNPDLAAESVHNARGEVQAALKEVRQSVAALRETPVDILNLPQSIEALVEETGRLSVLESSFILLGQPANLTPAAAMTLYRCAQEGLTNVQRHAVGAKTVCVQLAYRADGVQLSVEDDGQLVEENCQETVGGFGLAGLRERAHLLSGRLECGTRPEGSGFRVAIYLPLDRPQ